MTSKRINIHREITPLQENDCFLTFNRKRNAFTFPIHFHPEYEINYICKAKGARRIVGDHISEIENKELVMVGPNLYHGWENYKNNHNEMFYEITIQFPKDLFSSNLLNKNLLKPLKNLLKNANQGILFSKPTIEKIEQKLKTISHKQNFMNFIEFQSILYDLAISPNQKLLTNISFQQESDFYNSKKIQKIYNYITENYNKKIMLNEMAEEVNMTVITFGRLIKQRTGKSFVDFVNEIRLGFVTRELIESNKSITEICYDCGFNNLSNFNRIFKKRQSCTPTEFRKNFANKNLRW